MHRTVNDHAIFKWDAVVGVIRPDLHPLPPFREFPHHTLDVVSICESFITGQPGWPILPQFGFRTRYMHNTRACVYAHTPEKRNSHFLANLADHFTSEVVH